MMRGNVGMKKMLIPNGSFHDIPLIKEAKEMGYYVITSGAAPGQIGHQYADEYIYGDFSDKELMLKIAQENHIDAICSNCNDFGYLSACYVAEQMGLPGHESYDNAVILHHKNKFKELSKRLNLSSPLAESFNDLEIARKWLVNAEYPIIVKPTDLGAGQGIRRADTEADAEKAIEEAFSKSKSKEIVIEPFVEGTSHSFNAFIVNRKVASYYSDNEYMKYSKYRVSTSASPATGIEKVEKLLAEQTETVAKELKLTDGLVHSQYIMDTDGRPHILEITRRMSGDWYPYPEMKATGIDWVNYIVKAQCGMDCSDFPKNVKQHGHTGRHCLNGNRTGIVKKIDIKEDFKKHIYDSVMWLGDGFEINDIEKDYPGIVFFEFDDRDEMSQVIDNVEKYIELIYK
jgi:biotin carboxylase